LSEAFKVCPICETRNQRHAALCSTCGTTIADVKPRPATKAAQAPTPRYEYRLGESDLAEESLNRAGQLMSLVLILLIVLAAAAIAFALLSRPAADTGVAGAAIPPTIKPARIAGPTVTPGPPTATKTPSPVPKAAPTDTVTPSPCLRKVVAGDSLIAIVTGCGHRNLTILPTVMHLNGITDETRIQIGQEIIVPRPSATLDPAATATSTAETDVDSAAADSVADRLSLLAFDPFSPTETPTLLPGLMWHNVQPDENMIVIAVAYKTNAKALSDLNPEIQFSLCDFGLAYGGAECTVHLRQGQKIRVPAPTPTITPIPTASGSETPTPVPTATFNAPIAQSPQEGAFFAPQQRVTLRWVATGRLAPTHVYRIVLTDSDTGSVYSAETSELFFIIPSEWSPKDANSHRYAWQVSVLDTITEEISHTSQERTFVWQGSEQPSL
jgi:hypothetical protein